MGFYFANDGVQQGPFEPHALLSKGLQRDSLVWTEGMSDWRPATEIPAIAALFEPAPAPAAPGEPPVAPQVILPPTAPQPAHSPQAWQMGYQTPTTPPGNGMAVASMVLGIVSYPASILYCPGFITALLAIIFGFIARGKVKRGETTAGGGMALAGIVLGITYFLLIGGFILILLAIAANDLAGGGRGRL